MPIETRAEILKTPLAYHGAFDYDELEQLCLSPDEVIDFSVNSNPFGTPKSVFRAIADAPLDRYPDRECIALRRKLAVRHDVEMNQIVVGNGTAEILMLIAWAFMRRDDTVLIVKPTFSEYERSAQLAGANIITYFTDEADDFRPDITKLRYEIEQNQAKVVFLCNPNNPTGYHLDDTIIQSLVTDYPDTLFIIDEAYRNFVLDRTQVKATTAQNLLRVYSLTKDYALAGLRLGYALGHVDTIHAISQLRPAWNVNGLAQAAGLAVLDEDTWLQDTISRLHSAKHDLVRGLSELGLGILPSKVHYFLVKVGAATNFRQHLLTHKIMVRDCTSFGLPDHIRIATRTTEDNMKLLNALKKVL